MVNHKRRPDNRLDKRQEEPTKAWCLVKEIHHRPDIRHEKHKTNRPMLIRNPYK
jgi:hypothetical protein